MATLGDTAKYVRSKNAGPFTLTIDIFCEAAGAYEKVKNSKNLTPKLIATTYNVDESKVEFYYLPDLRVIKISLPRPYIQGHRHERDMHQGQQYVQLLDVEL